MKKYLIILYICFISLLFNSCYSMHELYSTGYIKSNYHDNHISVVYIDKTPYYQYWDYNKKYWYRRPVPKHRYNHIYRYKYNRKRR